METQNSFPQIIAEPIIGFKLRSVYDLTFGIKYKDLTMIKNETAWDLEITLKVTWPDKVKFHTLVLKAGELTDFEGYTHHFVDRYDIIHIWPVDHANYMKQV